ncbi:hypothetical protein [Moraxella lacunata]|uniref:hypothetical protein n=1 Tax=Moraxella lacunata TaxID=477 RepID=UPI003EE19781
MMTWDKCQVLRGKPSDFIKGTLKILHTRVGQVRQIGIGKLLRTCHLGRLG